MLKEKEKEKEQNAKMKALRRELEEKLEEQLPPEMLEDEKTRVEVQRIDESLELPAERAKQVIEALLFASSKPVTPAEIRRVMKFLTPKQIQELIFELRESYVREGRSFEILEVAGGYEIASKKEFAPWILKIELQKKAKQVTQSALETLSIMAYKQPITRAEIEELRGVDAGGVVNTLMERGLIKIVGKKEVPGRPFLYGTTEKFLEHFGLKSLQDLPNIEEIRNLVEKSVKKEELLGKTHLVDVTAEASASESTSAQENPSEESAEEEVSESAVSEDETVSAEESEPQEEANPTEGSHES